MLSRYASYRRWQRSSETRYRGRSGNQLYNSCWTDFEVGRFLIECITNDVDLLLGGRHSFYAGQQYKLANKPSRATDTLEFPMAQIVGWERKLVRRFVMRSCGENQRATAVPFVFYADGTLILLQKPHYPKSEMWWGDILPRVRLCLIKNYFETTSLAKITP